MVGDRHLGERLPRSSAPCDTLPADITLPDEERVCRERNAGPSRRDPSGTESIWVFPGLGCRHVGMGHDLFGNFAVADQMIAAAEAVLGYDLREACLEGSGRKHVPPRQEAQLIYVLECVYAAVLAELEIHPQIVAGHSLGNWAAAYASGAYDFLTGLSLVTHVEDLLEEHVDGRGQAMGVIVGLDEAVVASLLEKHQGAQIANWNSPGQYVIAGLEGDVVSVLTLAEGLQAKRAKRLPTNRALHTSHLAGVGELLRKRLGAVSWSDLRVPMMGCRDVRLLTTAEEVRDFLAEFLVQPVRWDATIRGLRQEWGDEFVEVGPGNVLSGMLPFIDRAAVIQTASEALSQNKAL